jgi:hypothetical protein
VAGVLVCLFAIVAPTIVAPFAWAQTDPPSTDTTPVTDPPPTDTTPVTDPTTLPPDTTPVTDPTTLPPDTTPVTEPPSTDPPSTEPPSTEPPSTDPPTTNAPTTRPPSTTPPTTVFVPAPQTSSGPKSVPAAPVIFTGVATPVVPLNLFVLAVARARKTAQQKASALSSASIPAGIAAPTSSPATTGATAPVANPTVAPGTDPPVQVAGKDVSRESAAERALAAQGISSGGSGVSDVVLIGAIAVLPIIGAIVLGGFGDTRRWFRRRLSRQY